MSWSLQVTNGDLVLGSGGMATVKGGSKLVQDLSCAVLEPMGTDPLHPAYGSLIDGGVDPDGQSYTGVIGSANDATTASFVETEIRRIAQSYQVQQIARNRTDVYIYGKSTLTADEALLSVANVLTQSVETNLLVQATLETGTGDLPLSVPITTT